MTKAPDKIEKIVDFLCGAAPNDQGEWFETVGERERGRFWWRKWVRQIEWEAHNHALALAAAEREACAEIVRPTPQYGQPDQLPDHEMIDMAMESRFLSIRARTNDDAQAALEQLLEKARNEALREAFNTLRTYAPHEVDGPEHDVGYASGYATAQNRILTLITEDQSDE